MSTTTTLGVALEDRDAQVDGMILPVELTSESIHVGALAVLRQAGKEVDYTSDEYVQACEIARKRLHLPTVHAAMAGGRSEAHVAA